MDPVNAKNSAPITLRRSTRSRERASAKSTSLELTPRAPIKRSRKKVDQSVAAVVNGTKDEENEDGESPSKKTLLDTAGADGDTNNDQAMEVSDSAKTFKENLDQEMETEDMSSKITKPQILNEDNHEAQRLIPLVNLGKRCHVIPPVLADEDRLKSKIVKPQAKPNVSPVNYDVRPKSMETKQDVQIRSIDDYQRTMKAKARSIDKPTSNHVSRSIFPTPETYLTQRRLDGIPKQKEMVRPAKLGKTKKTSPTTKRSEKLFNGFMWCLWRLVLPLLLVSVAFFLGYKIFPTLQMMAKRGDNQPAAVKPEKFTEQLSLLEPRFPSQLPELWKRSKIHLLKHLKIEKPNEPVSMILAAGLKAEKTLTCLAKSLASTVSSALNGSVLHIDGASKASQDSDKVKLDIDNLFKAAFEGDKHVAVIHRFEELPPHSTLIFYRYCDHENAAYKRVFFLFTLLLPQDEISSQLSLKDVEELVQEHTAKKLAASKSEEASNKLTVDMFGGLWSRISHLVLPVVSEDGIVEGECEPT